MFGGEEDKVAEFVVGGVLMLLVGVLDVLVKCLGDFLFGVFV